MIESIKFTEKWRCFDEGDMFHFVPGMNMLVGDQGSGKSSLIKAIMSGAQGKDSITRDDVRDKVEICSASCASKFFDFEKGNPRILSHFGKNMQFQLSAMWSSHGETNNALLTALDEVNKGEVIILDEPDTALSPRSCQALVKRFKSLLDRGVRIITAVHNPILIKSFDVYSLEHRLWMSGKDFLNYHLECEFCGCCPCGCGG